MTIDVEKKDNKVRKVAELIEPSTSCGTMFPALPSIPALTIIVIGMANIATNDALNRDEPMSTCVFA